jgi:hypothetical protein
MTRTRAGPPRWGDAAGSKGICLSASPSDTPSPQKDQAQIVARHGAAALRLVPPAPPPRPRRLEIRISAADHRTPYGHTRPIRLTHDDLDELIAVAVRMEGRRP